ncbi:MAG: tRNA lysidine(34) synthetase TilS [Micavibrio aeruginosavorus]|nr:tRNA lysidine(34) synthetase TilS [Micavibrio aeruginosavorus]
MEDFSRLFKKTPAAIAVAVSGGPDSMALLHMLSIYFAAQKKKPQIHALTVDHGLRPESAAEARQVGAWVADWPLITHHILPWKGRKPGSAIQERARAKRYELMAAYCAGLGIRHLFLAHHRTDQAETFLFRLAKGSGLDGLGGMATQAPYPGDAGFSLMRPLLARSKADLEAYCAAHDIPFIRDSSNQNRDYARVRLRQSLPVLEAEGLSEKRLAATAARLQRARQALDFYAAKIRRTAVTMGRDRAAIRLSSLRAAPEDIRLRVVRQVLADLGADGYGPRLERLETLLGEMFADIAQAKTFTLGGFVFSINRKDGALLIRREM